jgi:hypothetical protein
VSKENWALLTQRGATGTPQRAPRPYFPWCQLFRPITGTAHVDPQRSLVSTTDAKTSSHLISDTTWVVSIARKRESWLSSSFFFGTTGSDHAYLILEGIQNHRRFIIRAELTYDTSTEEVQIKMKPLDDLKQFAKSVAEGIEAHQFEISASVGQALLRHIQADQQKVIRYSLFGDGGNIYPSLLFTDAIPTPSSSTSLLPSASAPSNSNLNTLVSTQVATESETHNCLSWCRKQMMQIGKEMPIRWYNFAVTLPSDLTAPEESSASASTSSIIPRR